MMTTRLESLLDAVPGALVGMDQAGVIRFVNRQTESMFGYDRDSLVGQPIGTLVPKHLWSIYAERRASGTRSLSLDLELIGRQQDGKELPVNITLSQIDAGDVLLVFTATTTDVTRRKKAYENALPVTPAISTHDHQVTEARQAFESARSMIESSLDALVAISPEGRITDVNEATVKVTGIPRIELIGTAFSDCFTEPAKANAIYQLVFEKGMAVDYPLTMRHRDGTLTEVRYNASVYRDAGGKVLGVFAAARDVTEAKQAFESARSMIESSLDALVAISPEGRITDVNEATVKVTGIPRVELIGTAFSDCFTEPAKANAIYQLVFEKGMAVDYPLTMRHQDGTVTEVLYNASVYRDAGGKVLGVFAAARDVTHQMQAQREIVDQQAKALERLAELERFQRLTVGRELKMIELKKEIEWLRKFGPADEVEIGDEG